MTAAALALTGLHKRLGAREVLTAVDLSVAAGELVALIGPNGAGKSTLVRCASGRLRPDRGSVRLAGLDPLRRRNRRRLGLVPQELALFPRLSVRENLEIFARLLRVPRRQLAARVRMALEQADLLACAEQRADTLSGGMRRRLNLVASLLHDPAVLLLDEPTVGVDAAALERIEALLDAERRKGTAVLLVTHDLELAERLAARVAVMRDGRILADAPPAELIEHTFGGALEVLLTLAGPPDPALCTLLTTLRFTARDPCSYARRCDSERADTLLRELTRRGVRAREIRVRDPGLADACEALLHGAATAPAAGLPPPQAAMPLRGRR